MDKNRAMMAHFRKNDPVMFALARKGIIPVKPIKPNHYFHSMCREIIGQQLAGSAASAIFARFEKLFPDGKITPEYAAGLKEQSIRNIGASWAKSRYIVDLGKKVSGGEVDLRKISRLENQQIIEELTKVNGIGPWTAEMFLMFTMGREDVFSHGDLGLRKAIMKHYKLKNPEPNDAKRQAALRDRIEKIAAKWSPYRTYACRILWRSLEA